MLTHLTILDLKKLTEKGLLERFYKTSKGVSFLMVEICYQRNEFGFEVKKLELGLRGKFNWVLQTDHEYVVFFSPTSGADNARIEEQRS